MEVGQKSHKGKIRSINEDSFYVSDSLKTSNTGYVIVADGMGGHSQGEVASSVAVDYIKNYLKQSDYKSASLERLDTILREAIEGANKAVYQMSVANKGRAGMGTTVVVCCCKEKFMVTANVGDSRAYLITNDKIKRVTKDHSVVQLLLDTGSITPSEAKKHPEKNVITRAVGVSWNIQIDTYREEIKKDDIFIICSDGLTNLIDDSELLEAFTGLRPVQEVVEELVKTANDRGGFDNITLAAVRI